MDKSFQAIIFFVMHPGTNIYEKESMAYTHSFDTLRPIQNGRHFADDMFKCIFLNEKVWIPIEISLKFVLKGSINNNCTEVCS